MYTLFAGCSRETPFDIVFIIDSSSSIWQPDFERQILFVRDVSRQFDIGLRRAQSRVGLVSFADSYYPQFHLWQNNRPDLLERALNRVRHRAGRKTNTGAALDYVSKYMFTHRYGSRKDAAHVIILITDGQSTDRHKTLTAAKRVREAGIHLFAVGVGDQVDFRELEEVASSPPQDYVFEVEDYKSLDMIKYHVANKTCRGTLNCFLKG